jgi:hypothetical protein
MIDSATWRALCVLYENPWFSRVWVIQEIQLADANESLLMLGSRSILWRHFCITVAYTLDGHIRGRDRFDSKLTDWSRILRNIPPISSFTDDFNRLPLPRLLNAIRASHCSDPRDRIFGLLSLSKDLRIQPDYTSSLTNVCRRVVDTYIKDRQALTLLTLCELHTRHVQPSWIPDVAILKHTDSIGIQLISSPILTGQTVQVDGHMLKVQGVRLATLAKFSATFEDVSAIRSAAGKEIKLLLSREVLTGDYPTGGTTFAAVVGTFLARTFQYDPSLQEDILRSYYDEFADFRAAMGKMLPLWKTRKRASLPVCHVAERLLLHRRLFYTEEGHIGFCSPFARKWDVLVMIYGCPAPLILRPVTADTYKLVAEAYCYGLMDGEPFLGRLPEGVGRFYDTKQRMPIFVDSRTLESTTKDPRLGSLREDWEEHSKNQDVNYPRFRNKRTGEFYSARMFDPRMTIPELEKGGIRFETFVIV